MLIILGGLPGVGKSTLARELARAIGAVHLRIDSIEQALRDAGAPGDPMDDAGYRVAYAVAADNLRLGRTVIADCVNPVAASRTAWRTVAAAVPVAAVEIEIICSDTCEHRRRVETRSLDLPGLVPPTWAEIETEIRTGGYEPWDRERIVVDTAGSTVADNVRSLRAQLARR
jgi:predicted kinase